MIPLVYVDKNAHITVVDDDDTESSSEDNIEVTTKVSQEKLVVPAVVAARSAPIVAFDWSLFKKKAAKIIDDPLPDDVYTWDHKKLGAKEKKWRNIENERTSKLYNKFQQELERLKAIKPLRSEKPEDKKTREHLISCLENELAKQARYNEELRKQKRSNSSRSSSLKSTTPSARCSVSPQADAVKRPSGKGPAKIKRAASELETKKEEKEFTTFFKKPHLKIAAIKNYRKSARNAVAFGEPLPVIGTADFDLPTDFIEEGQQVRKRQRLV